VGGGGRGADIWYNNIIQNVFNSAGCGQVMNINPFIRFEMVSTEVGSQTLTRM
jgi:hypothetical protein